MAALSVAVIGGGIGGTAAALSLLQSGFDVHVYEQARESTYRGSFVGPDPALENDGGSLAAQRSGPYW